MLKDYEGYILSNFVNPETKCSLKMIIALFYPGKSFLTQFFYQ